MCGAVFCLVALGMVMVFSAGAAFAARRYGDWTFFLKREAIYALIGLAAFAFAVRTDYSIYRRITYPLLFFSVALLGLVLIFGPRVNGAVRWFRFAGLSFQPSELMKFSLALYVAVLLARKADQVRNFSIGFLPPLLITGLVMGLLLAQPDLGTAVVIGAVTMAMLFVAGTRTSYILAAILLAAPIGWKFLVMGKGFRQRRLLAFLNPFEFRQKESYQLYESLISVGSGGPFGRGLGEGRQKLFYLPEAHTDFILSIIGEELGLVGILLVLMAFMILVWRGYLAAARARDVFGSYLAFGLSSLFGLQALVNMAVVLGSLPTKGIPLPFISYGGSSLVVSLFIAGVLANISARNPEPRPAPFFAALGRRIPGRNKRAEAGTRVVVDTGKGNVRSNSRWLDGGGREPGGEGAGPDPDPGDSSRSGS
jgi:cell division protein FtsW